MTKQWIIRNDRGEYLVGFFADNRPRWRSPSEPLAASEAIHYTTADLSAVAIPALSRAECDAFTVERAL